ncbi:hypothetical protein [Bacillus sp. UMB0728]|uniref:hypothetical protein n=1 Tax=Bacillus sp. UMB0728 TaxID=2066052 RepID=UPI000C75E641|nr:hypothetical protein [Bacillus sp. UMB0728]PLR73504.1 hypothetical protein CYJ37_08155 [Bacillus sp. UMB0728]
MKKKSPYKLMLINMLVFTLILVNIAMWPKVISYLNPEERAEVPSEGSAAESDQSSAESSFNGETVTGEKQEDSSGDSAKDKDIFKIVEIK